MGSVYFFKPQANHCYQAAADNYGYDSYGNDPRL